MSREIVDKTINFALDNFDEKQLKFVLYGGEPLLNFELVKYLIENYPMLRFVIITNGLRIKEPGIKELLIKSRNNLYVSLSVGIIRTIFRDKFKEIVENSLEVVRDFLSDVHYVATEPEHIFDDFLFLFNEGVKMIRLSLPRSVDLSQEVLENCLEEFKKVADYVYFGDNFVRDRINFDRAFKGNILNRAKNLAFGDHEPLFCGCGSLYLSIDYAGNIYPCDWFCGLNMHKLGDIFNGFIEEEALLFKGFEDNRFDLYKDCKDCEIPDIRLCPRAMCLAENYQYNDSLTKPLRSHCQANIVEYKLYDYIARKAAAKGLI